MHERRVLFWLLIIGVLFYFHVDMKITRLERDMRMQMLLLEKVLQQALPHTYGTRADVPHGEWSSSSSPAPITAETALITPRCNTLQAPSNAFDDLVPTREELARVMAPRAVPRQEDVTAFGDVTSFTGSNLAPVNF